MKKAIYPGSFDPITNGHLDILKRSLKMFDEVTILIADNPNKKFRFSVDERIEMINEAIKDIKGAKVDSTKGLSVAYAKSKGAVALVRGLRAVTDFEYEFQLNAANEYIDNSIDTVFFMSQHEISFISSSTIDELFSNGIDISNLVPKSVVNKYKNRK